MLSTQIFDLYRKPQNDDSIVRLESRTYLPFVKSFQNNDTIEITINRKDIWTLMYDAEIVIRGSLKVTSETGSVGFVNNAGAFFFDYIAYELNGVEVDNVKDPGIVSTIRGYLCYNEDDSRSLAIGGWNYPERAIYNDDGTFFMRIPARHLLNIFNDYKVATCGKQTLRLVRARNDSNSVIVVGNATTTSLSITNVELCVKHISPNDILKLELLKALNSDKPILMPFRRWEFHELPSLTDGGTKEVWAVKTCAGVESPRFVIVAFQTAIKDNEKKDSTNFNNIDASDIRLLLNGEYYPYERMRLNFTNNDFMEAHRNYTDFYPSYMQHNDKPSLLDYEAFKSHAVFVIDCSRRDETIKSSTIDVKVEIEARTAFPTKTRAYCIIIHDCIMEYLPLSEIVRKIS